MVDNGENNFEEQQDEIEALESIFVEEFTLEEEKPYKFEVLINANSEDTDKNFLKLRLIFELPQDYP